MIFPSVLVSIQNCKRQIEKDFGVDLETNTKTKKVLLRGENRYYEKTEPSMKRFLQEQYTIRSFEEGAPFVDFEDIYSEYHGERNGLTTDEGLGFLQHYGLPTDVFDLTTSFEVSAFFATYKGDDSPIGMIGVFERESFDVHFATTDLTLHPFAKRPRRQYAFGSLSKSGLYDLKAEKNDSFFKSIWYVFLKTAGAPMNAERAKDMVYPSEEELMALFGNDLIEFIRGHSLFQEGESDLKNALIEMCNKILEQNRNP